MALSKSKDLQTSPRARYSFSVFTFSARTLITVILAGILTTGVSVLLPKELWVDLAKSGYFQPNLLGFVSLVCIYVLAILLLAPLSPFALAAGLLFGFWWGTLLALVALNMGSALAFIIARYLLPRPFAQQFLEHDRHGKVAAVAEALRGEAVLTIAVLRLNPLVPFNLQNYICGLTGVGFGRYALATFLGASPFTVALVYLGYAGRQLANASGLQVEEWILLLCFVAVLLTVPLSWVTIRRVVKHLRECHKNDKIAAQKD